MTLAGNMRNAGYQGGKLRFALGVLLAGVIIVFPVARGFRGAAAETRGSGQRRAAKPNTAVATGSPSSAMAFHAGETLNYRVAWAAFSSAATVQLTVPERRDLFGWKTWHFRATAHTLSPVRSLFAVDDQFDSYSDEATLASHQYETHLSEMGRKQDQVLHLVSPGQTSRAAGPSVEVLAGTRDPLGAFYALRGVDWQRTPELRAFVYDGRDVFEMSAKRESASETVTVAGGQFSASRVTVRVFQHGKELPSIRFSVWFTNDAVRTPVVIQAQLPFGNLRAELASAPQ
jgi:Protein of unknown function (DUF3108)